MHALDNVIWKALTTRQAEFADSVDKARRFQRNVTSLTGFSEATAAGYESLSGLVGPGGKTGSLFLDEPYQPRAGWEALTTAPLLQMVFENDGDGAEKSATAAASRPAIIELGAQDSPEMVELTTLCKPGPFGTRTHELGTYLGIRRGGRLVAMAGERLKVPGYTEVSAVCTHPEHTGKGYAAALMMEVVRRIRERGEIPFLHVREANTRAIELYNRLGFRKRVQLHQAALRRIGPAD
jgi:ribosomal protein S18 acetylase RimI-like enzyme